MLSYAVINRIQDMADWASKESGTSYEDYIRLFTLSVDKEFRHTLHFRHAVSFAIDYGYMPKAYRKRL
jgi:adenosine deaminase